MTRFSGKALALTMTFSMAFVLLPSPADAATKFDGSWDFEIITTRGACDRSLRLSGGQITNGIFFHPLANATNVSGRVAASGVVTVAVSMGSSRAAGSGRLSTVSGAGTWRGVGPSGACSGTWQAHRS
jgi:hypothetical protein